MENCKAVKTESLGLLLRCLEERITQISGSVAYNQRCVSKIKYIPDKGNDQKSNETNDYLEYLAMLLLDLNKCSVMLEETNKVLAEIIES